MDHLARHAQEVGRLTAAVEPFTADKASAISGVTPEELGDFLVAVRKNGRFARRLAQASTCREGNLVAWLGWAFVTHRRNARTGNVLDEAAC